MPNGIKYTTGATETGCLRKGNMLIANNTADYGSTFYSGITPPAGGYTIYLNKASGGPSIYTAANDSQLISLSNTIAGQTFATAAAALAWFATQTDKMVFNRDYEAIVTNGLVLNLDAGFTPSYPTTGTTWYDLSSSVNNGTLTNGPTYSSDNGGSIVFDGTNDYVNCGDIFNDVMAGAGKQFTYNCTFVPAGTGLINQFLFGKYADGGFTAENGREFAVAVRNDGSGLKIRVVFSTNLSGSANAVDSDTTLVVNNTYNISITYDDTQSTSLGKVNIYINGIISSKTLTVNGAFGPIAAGPAKFGLGAGISSTNQTGYHFNGRIFNLSLYSKLLTSVEITQNYNAQKSRFGL